MKTKKLLEKALLLLLVSTIGITSANRIYNSFPVERRQLAKSLVESFIPYRYEAYKPGRKIRATKNKWDFKFKDTVVSAWYTKIHADKEFEEYKNAGFNVILSTQY